MLQGAQLAQHYRDEGYFSPLDVLSVEETAQALAGFHQLADRLGGAPKPTQLFLLHLYHRWAWDLVTHPRVLEAVEQVLGSNVLVWDSSIFPKPPRSAGYVSMHQDGTYWGLDRGEVVTAWIALTDSTHENGCMRIVPGSHQLSIQPHEDTHDPDNLLTRGQEVRAPNVEHSAIDLELRAGQMSLHHVRLIHGSHANSSDRARVGYAVRYVTPEVIPSRRTHPSVLAKGKDVAGHWEVQTAPPEYASFEDAHHAQQEAARRHLRELT